MEYRVITISGEVATGKSRLAESLQALLPGWSRLNTGQLFRETTAALGMSIQQVSFLPDDIHRQLDNMQLDRIREAQHAIIEGRLAGWLARNEADAFRVFCFAPLPVRVQRYGQRDGADPVTALQDIQFRDQKDVEKYRRIYGVDDYRLPAYYHLILDTSLDLPDPLARRVIDAAGLAHLLQRDP